MQTTRPHTDIGGLIVGALLLFVGGYYVLTNTLGITLPDLNWDLIWPIIVVALGFGVLYRAAGRSGMR
jgi:uncharacterized integral membrane protein